MHDDAVADAPMHEKPTPHEVASLHVLVVVPFVSTWRQAWALVLLRSHAGVGAAQPEPVTRLHVEGGTAASGGIGWVAASGVFGCVAASGTLTTPLSGVPAGAAST